MDNSIRVCHGLQDLIADGAEAPSEVAIRENDDLHGEQHVDCDRRRQTSFSVGRSEMSTDAERYRAIIVNVDGLDQGVSYGAVRFVSPEEVEQR